MAYATIAELEARLGRPLADPEQAQALLDDAADLINSFNRRNFELVTDDERVLRPVGLTVRLPQTPVQTIHSVHAIGGAEGFPDFPLHGWVFDGIDQIDLRPIDPAVWVQLPEWWNDRGFGYANTYRVVYDHGYPPDEIPKTLKVINLAMVLRILTSPSASEGMISENIGQYNYQLQQGVGSYGLGVRLTAGDKERLKSDGFRKGATTVQVRA